MRELADTNARKKEAAENALWIAERLTAPCLADFSGREWMAKARVFAFTSSADGLRARDALQPFIDRDGLSAYIGGAD